MFFCDTKLILSFIALSSFLALLNAPPFLSLLLLILTYVIAMGEKDTKGCIPLKKTANISPHFGRSQKNIEIQYGEKRSKAFLELTPIVSHPQKKTVFYHCKIYYPQSYLNDCLEKNYDHQLSFFECLNFFENSEELDKNIRYIIDLPTLVLNDETYFDLFLYTLQNNKTKKDYIIFNITHQVLNTFLDKLCHLKNLGILFNISSIPVDKIEDVLQGPLSKNIYSCQVSQSQLLELVRDELMNEKIHSLHGYMTRLMVSDIKDPRDINDLPNIVDYVCGKEFSKPLTIAI
ncbi:MAG: hypothetical protein HEEMFOPI_01340 [Holosporales bacterium]